VQNSKTTKILEPMNKKNRIAAKVLLSQNYIDIKDLQKEKGGLRQEPSQKEQNPKLSIPSIFLLLVIFIKN
jgi:hypothetical protein